MKCPACGYLSLDLLEACRNCGAPMVATTTGAFGSPQGQAPPAAGPERADTGPAELRLACERPEPRRPARGRRRGRKRADPAAGSPGPVEPLDDDALEVSELDLEPLGPAAGERDCADGGMPFHIDDDLFAQDAPAGVRAPAAIEAPTDQAVSWPLAADLPEPAFVLEDADPGGHAGGEPVIDREDEVPEQFWAPQIAGVGRRAAALAVDQSLLALVLGLFILGAFLALRLSGFDTDLFLAAAGLKAALPLFALLAAVLSLAYHAFFHGYAGRTPGKALAGLELRRCDGTAPSWGRVVLRWFCAALGLAVGGIGFVWALFDGRRRGWADLLSGTVIARRHSPAGGGGRR